MDIEYFNCIDTHAAPTEIWNSPLYWDQYYADLFSASSESYRKDFAVHRNCNALLRFFGHTKTFPIDCEHPRRLFLDAGCGVALLPNLLATWGFQVTAIDSCSDAISIVRSRTPAESDLANCIEVWDPVVDENSKFQFIKTFELVDDPDRSMDVLRKYKIQGGSVSHFAVDWFDASLDDCLFDYIFCGNGLRRSAKPYWYKSLRRFFDLLAPGGTLILETSNVFAIRDEVHELLAEVGFIDLGMEDALTHENKHCLAYWPSG